ncbi:KR domain-containing protein [Mycena olivaceomarginata]|nr:KR domain-containing protein [Mycena olivaceomarginata]
MPGIMITMMPNNPNVKECLASLRNLLVPGGCLFTVELDGSSWTSTNKSGSIWSDAVFGPFQEWFAFTDGRNHCTMAPEMWKQLLEDVDFMNVQTCVESGGDGREFFFVAQKSISYSTPASDPDIDLRHVYPFEFGKEIQLQRRLRDIDIATSTTIYLLAMHGRDADAAIGKDIPSWDIRLAIFESSTDLSNPIPLLIRHIGTLRRGENVIAFDGNGDALVPRVALSPPPSSNQRDAVDDPSYLTVRVSHWVGISQVYDGFVGKVVQSNQHGVSAGRICRCCAARIAIAIENENLAPIIEQHASKISGIQLVSADFRNPDILEVLDILISDSTTYAQHPHLRRWIPRSGKVFLLDNLLEQTHRDDPSYIRRTLANGLRVQSETPARQNGRISHLAAASGPRKSRAAPPFRDDRAYVLLGGIGGLGIDLAVWMYQHGARHLILTSRRGVGSLDPIKDALTLGKVAYLQSQNDGNLQLCKCDATDDEQMQTLLHGLPVPVAGCFLMTLVLSDAPFFKQTQYTFNGVSASKLRWTGWDSWSDHLCELMVSSACTALDGVLAAYPNAFSLITPGILDAGYLDRTITNRKDDLAIISAEALWAYLEDGLKKLDDFPFKHYIPDVDWRIVDRQFTLPISCRHLLSPNSREPAASQPHQLDREAILNQVLELLEVSLSDFDVTQPLATYGLDSLSAAKLSTILRPYASFSPLQLLGGVTWSEIKDQLQYPIGSHALGGSGAAKTVLLDVLGISPDDFSPDIPLSSYGLDSLGASKLATGLRPFMTVTQMQLMGQTTWTELLELAQLPAEWSPDPSAQPLVEICSGSGQPLIILPGGHFQGALWAIQITESTPLKSLAALVGFWKEQICAKWPHGPYRFAAYSGSTLLSVALVKLMENTGEEVVKLTRSIGGHVAGKDGGGIRDFSDQSLLDLLRIDSTSAEALVSYEAAILGLPNAPPNTVSEVKVLAAVMTLQFNFLQQFYPADREKSHDSFVKLFTAWLCSFKAPLVLLVAELGFAHCAPRWMV